MRVTRSKIRWVVEGLVQSLASPRRRLAPHLAQVYGEGALARSRIPTIGMRDFIGKDWDAPIELEHFIPDHMNVTVTELAFLSLLVRTAAPRVILELGTYDGNTTLQLAANSRPEALVYTVDLPDSRATRMHESGERPRRYAASLHGAKVRQRHADTMSADFAALCDGHRPSLVFVDAGHRYANVKNDTEKSLAILERDGVLVWHDYAYNCAGVFNYLNELSQRLPLVHVRDTALVACRVHAA
ncbi:MAG TPA: class I SAM-dependent methyltransferase [Burkholderiales bacterium]|nr:class I SAM-dependent methyltransferase [Burkholderiales bacterium]